MNRIFRQAEAILDKEDTAKFRAVYFLTFAPVSVIDLSTHEEEIINNIVKSVRKQKPCGSVQQLRKSSHRRSFYIAH